MAILSHWIFLLLSLTDAHVVAAKSTTLELADVAELLEPSLKPAFLQFTQLFRDGFKLFSDGFIGFYNFAITTLSLSRHSLESIYDSNVRRSRALAIQTLLFCVVVVGILMLNSIPTSNFPDDIFGNSRGLEPAVIGIVGEKSTYAFGVDNLTQRSFLVPDNTFEPPMPGIPPPSPEFPPVPPPFDQSPAVPPPPPTVSQHADVDPISLPPPAVSPYADVDPIIAGIPTRTAKCVSVNKWRWHKRVSQTRASQWWRWAWQTDLENHFCGKDEASVTNGEKKWWGRRYSNFFSDLE